MARFTLQLLFACIFLSRLCESATSQDITPADPAVAAHSFLEIAKSYTITTVAEPDDPFELVRKPLLAWSNPERSTPSGAVFLYTSRGRPQAALCVYPNAGKLDHEFQSLATELLVAERDGALVWSPQSAGVEMKPLDGGLLSRATPFLRLRLMRDLARSFEAAIVHPSVSPKPLRLLTTPVYRYPASGLPKGIVDGAIFAFVQSTDPEVLLLIEARENATGERQWFFGLARMSMYLLSVRRGDEEIWSTELAVPDPNSAYYTIGGN